MIRVLVVDDSVVFRTLITEALRGNPAIEVVDSAPNGKIALSRLEQTTIDVMTLDMEMPVMDGMELLRELKKRKSSVKTIVFSSQTLKGAERGLEALREGAIDIVAKPSGGSDSLVNPPTDKIREILVPKILQFKTPDTERVLSGKASSQQQNEQKSIVGFMPSVIVIAASTGGPAALEKIFSNLNPPLRVPILIAQHMPPVFTEILSRRLADISGLPCKEAVNGEPIVAGTIYIAPGDYHLKVVGTKHAPLIELNQANARNFVRPSADYLFESCVEIFGKNTLGIVLTGMGEDGLCGARAIKKSNGRVLIQSEESCVVFGMPGSVFKDKSYDAIGDLEMITQNLQKMVKV